MFKYRNKDFIDVETESEHIFGRSLFLYFGFDRYVQCQAAAGYDSAIRKLLSLRETFFAVVLRRDVNLLIAVQLVWCHE